MDLKERLKNTYIENLSFEKLKLELEKEKALRKRREFELEVLKKKRSSKRSCALENKIQRRV